mgnify:CR=1 FL=1
MNLSSIVKKSLMAFTGLALVGFLVTHLAGNLLLFAPLKFNAYAHMLEENPFLVPAEIGLLTIFLLHLFFAIKLTLENRAARPEANAVRHTAGESTFASRTMFFTGLLIFFFLVIHIKMFKFGDKDGMNGVWGMVVREFKQPQVALFYVLCMIGLGFHISHGISSAFQSLGLLKPGARPKLRPVATAIGWGIALGFAILPLWAWTLAKDEPIDDHAIQLKVGAADPRSNAATTFSRPDTAQNVPVSKAQVE